MSPFQTFPKSASFSSAGGFHSLGCSFKCPHILGIGSISWGWTVSSQGGTGPFLVISLHIRSRVLCAQMRSGGTPSSRIRPSLLPPATFPLSPHPFLSLRPPLPSVEPPEPEAGESGDTGVRRGLLEGAKPGGAPGYSAGVGLRREGRREDLRRLGPGKMGRALRWTVGLGSGRLCS